MVILRSMQIHIIVDGKSWRELKATQNMFICCGDNKYYVWSKSLGDEFWATGPVFSPDSKHVIYIASEYWLYEKKSFAWHALFEWIAWNHPSTWHRTYVLVDDVEGESFDGIFGGIVFDSPNTFHYVALENNKVYLIKEKI